MEEETKTRSFKEEGLANRRAFLRSYPLRWEDENDNEEKEERKEEEDSESIKEDVIIRNKKRYFKVKALMKNNLIVVLQWGEGKLLLLRKIKTRFPLTSISSESKSIPWFTVPPKEEEEEEEGHESPQAKVGSLMRNHLIGVLQWGEGKILLLRKTKTSSPTIHFDSNSIPSFSSRRMEREKSDHSRDMASRSFKVKSLMKSNLIMVHHWGEGKLLILRKIKRRPPSTSTPSIHLEEDEEKEKEGDSPQGKAASRDKKLYSKLSMMKNSIKDMLQWKEGKLPLMWKIKTTTTSNSTLAVLLDSEHPASSSQVEKKEVVASRMKLSYSKVKSVMKRSSKWNVSKSVKL